MQVVGTLLYIPLLVHVGSQVVSALYPLLPLDCEEVEQAPQLWVVYRPARPGQITDSWPVAMRFSFRGSRLSVAGGSSGGKGG